MMKTSTVIKKLQKAFPDISGIRQDEECPDAIHLGNCAEGGTIDGISACDYYGGFEDPKEKIWIMGVHHKLDNLLERLGYYAEPKNAGEYVAYKI